MTTLPLQACRHRETDCIAECAMHKDGIIIGIRLSRCDSGGCLIITTVHGVENHVHASTESYAIERYNALKGWYRAIGWKDGV